MRKAQTRALAAAHAATEAATELLRFAREGEAGRGPFDGEPIEKLADALKMALEVEVMVPFGPRDDEREQLHHALLLYLDGWA